MCVRERGARPRRPRERTRDKVVREAVVVVDDHDAAEAGGGRAAAAARRAATTTTREPGRAARGRGTRDAAGRGGRARRERARRRARSPTPRRSAGVAEAILYVGERGAGGGGGSGVSALSLDGQGRLSLASALACIQVFGPTGGSIQVARHVIATRIRFKSLSFRSSCWRLTHLFNVGTRVGTRAAHLAPRAPRLRAWRVAASRFPRLGERPLRGRRLLGRVEDEVSAETPPPATGVRTALRDQRRGGRGDHAGRSTGGRGRDRDALAPTALDARRRPPSRPRRRQASADGLRRRRVVVCARR